jgi:hypothetical protein
LKNSVFKQLPAGLMLAFQALSATFTNQCNWHASNWWLTVGLVTVLSATCVFSSFTDSVVYNGKVHKGVAFPGRLHLNLARKEQQVISKELRKRGLKSVDCLHAVLRAVVFLTIAGSDVGSRTVSSRKPTMIPSSCSGTCRRACRSCPASCS